MADCSPLRIGIDLHNLSVQETVSVRTGIQQVVFNLLEAQHWARNQPGQEVEWVPLSMLPLNCPRFVYKDLKPTHVNSSSMVLKEAAEELDIPEQELWGYDPASMLGESGESEFYRKAASLDWLVITGLCEYRHVLHFMKHINPTLKIAVLVHDLIPVQTPRLTAEGMPNWYFRSFIGSIRQGTDLIFTVSRNTGLDCAQYLGERIGPHVPIFSTRLPAEIPVYRGESTTTKKAADFLQSFGVEEGRYWICLGTIEPRKNIKAAIQGFVKLRNSFPEYSKHRLVICGKKGWRGEAQQLMNSLGNLKSEIVFTNYLSREDMERLIALSNALVMPSRYEGFGLPLSLADQLGTPTISCLNSSLPEASGTKNIWVDPDSPDQMVLALKQFDSRNLARVESPKSSLIRDQWRQMLMSWKEEMLNLSSEVEEKNYALPREKTNAEQGRGRPTKILIDTHNLSIQRDKWVKTGIQEVSYQIIKAVAELRCELREKNIEIILLPLLPTVNFYPRHSTTALCHEPVFREIEESLNMPSKEVWGFDFQSHDYSLDLEAFAHLAKGADWFLVTSQFDVRRCFEWFRVESPQLKISHIVHDIIPALMPSKVDPYLAEWFTFDLLQSIEQFSDLVVTVSTHSALDFQKQLSIPRPSLEICSLPLPSNQKIAFDQQKVSCLKAKHNVDKFFMVIGSTDPRKNVANVIDAFRAFHALYPDVAEDIALLIVGPKLWRTEDIKQAKKQSSCHIVETGYVDDELLHGLIANSSGVCMPSRYEGFGLPIALANSYGVPVMTCANSSLPEVSQMSAVYVDPASKAQMVLAYLQMTEKKPQKVTVSDRDNWQHYVKSLVDVHLSCQN